MSPTPDVVVMNKVGAVVNPLQVMATMVDYTDQWVTEVIRAQTERASIAAWERTQTQRIQEQRAVLMKALELTFDERRENFRRLFDGLDSAMAAGDPSQVGSYLEAITELAKESPFKELANLEIVASELKRPDRVWEV